jgi:DNA-binding response OmpR family regulator
MAKRILIADDSVTIQKAFAMTFAGADDVTVSGARSADEGLALAQRTHPDLVIADGVMPGRSGYDLCASIKADPALRAVPVLILASNQQPYDAARGQKAGADGQLTKPWDTTTLADKVREVLRGGAPAPAVGPPAAPPPRAAASLPTAAIDDDDEYGEISIDTDTGRDSIPTIPRVPAVAPAPAASSGGRISSPSMPAVPAAPAASVAPASSPAAGGSSPGMRPSLIPGMRPGAMPPARPGTMPARPTGPLPTTAPPRPTAQPVGRTLMGVPAANIPIPGVMRPSMPSMPAMPSGAPMGPPPAPPPRAPTPTGPAMPLDMRARVPTPPPRQRLTTPPPPAPLPTPVAAKPGLGSPVTHASVAASVEQKLAAMSAKGPEYEAIAKLSREIIEQVVWEVVPELAEAIIREHVKNKGIGG